MSSTLVSAVRTMSFADSTSSSISSSPRGSEDLRITAASAQRVPLRTGRGKTLGVSGVKPFFDRHAQRVMTLLHTPLVDDNTPPPPPPPKDMNATAYVRRLPPPPPPPASSNGSSSNSTFNASSSMPIRGRRPIDSVYTLHLKATDPSSPLFNVASSTSGPSTPRVRAHTVSKATSESAPNSPPAAPGLRPSPSLPSKYAPSRPLARARSAPRLTPEERAAQRAAEKARLSVEQEQAEFEEQERQARLKAAKNAALREQQLEDHHRRMRLEDELRAAAFQKDLRQRQEEEEAQRAQELLREKRRLQKERLAEENAWLEACRKEEALKEEELRAKREAERLELENERRSRIQRAGAGDYIGWINVQQEGMMQWKRRWCKLRGSRMSLFIDPPGELVS
jgi:hypothetical protein